LDTSIETFDEDVPPYVTRNDPDPVRAAYRKATPEWLDLDSLLVRVWESRSIRPCVIRTLNWVNDTGDCIGSLLPEMMRRGMIDLAVAVGKDNPEPRRKCLIRLL